MKIQLKRSNVLDGGAAKQPTAGQMEYGEIAVNYNETDPVLFIKDSNDAIIRIAGAGSSGSFDGDYNNLTNKPTIGDGTITIKNADGSDNASFSVNQTGPTEITLPAGFSGDYDDLTNQPTIGDGTITIKSGGTNVGTFTVNQTGDTEIDIPATSWGDIDEKPIYIDTNTPSSPNNGDLWVDLNECPPELKIWSDCSGTGQWEGIESTPDLSVITPVLSGNASQGEVLTSTLGHAVGGKAPYTYVYTFQDQNDNVLQATAANTYTLVSADVGKTITVSVTAADSRGTVETSFKSNAIGPIVPPEAVNAPTLLTPANNSTDLSVNSITLTCSAYSGVQSVYGSTTWQVSTAADFSSTVYDVTNSNQTSNVATFSPALNYDVTYYARCKHTSSNGIASDFSNVNTFTTGADPVDPNNPNADMSGLRFDGARSATLSKTFAKDSDTYTYSAWFKRLETKSDRFHLLSDTFNANGEGCRIRLSTTNGIVEVNMGTGPSASEGYASTNTLPINEWGHVVVSYDGATKKLNISVNGNTDTFTTTASFVFGTQAPWFINRYRNGQSEHRDGYFSEVYFVDGEALEPTAFGKTFPDGRWGPLDSSIITDNINNSVVSPYDQRPNMEQEWSADLSGPISSAPYDKTKMFDGSLNTWTDHQGENVTITWTNTLTNVTSLRVYVHGGNSTNTVTTVGDSGTQVDTISANFGPGWHTISLTETGSTINSIAFRRGGSGNFLSIYAIEVNNQILADGPANNSQNWSANTIGSVPPAKGTYADVFDGDLTTSAGATGSDADFTINFSGFNSINSLEVYIVNNSNIANSGYIVINGGNQITTNVSSNWQSISASSLSSITFGQKGTLSSNLFAVRVNGEILIDSGEQWNTSHVWSKSLAGDFRNDRGPERAFDGDETTSTIVNSGNIVFTIPTGVSGVLRVYTSLAGQGIDIDGTSVGTSTAGWNVVGAVTAGHKVTVATSLEAWELNGVLLVDKGSFGTNGFHLPFDPTNTGQVWSSTPNNGQFAPNQPIENAFDGDLTTYAQSFAGNVKLVINIPKTSGNFRVYTTGFDALYINGTDMQQSSSASGWYWETLGDLTDVFSIELVRTGNKTSVSMIEVDGEILVDHNSIGVDASGNKNNFHDENFAVGNTSKVWSNGTFTSNGSPDESPQYLFNGDLSTPGLFSGLIEWDSPVIQGITSFEVYASAVSSNSVDNARKFEVNGIPSTSVNTTALGTDGFPGWYSFSGITELNSFEVTSVQLQISAIRVNGEILVDKNIQDTVTDTPLMSYAVLESGTNGNLNGTTAQNSTVSVGTDKIYLESTAPYSLGPSGDRHHVGIYAANGTQKGRFRSDGNTIGFSTSGSYSWSASDLVGFAYDASTGKATIFVNGTEVVTGTRTFTSDPDDRININGANEKYTVNFGQQPFVASNVTYDQETGIVELPFNSPYDERANTDQVWSNSLSPSEAFSEPAVNAFSGDLSTRAANNKSGGGTLTLTASISVAEKIEVLTGAMNLVVIDGTPVGSAASDPDWVKLTGARTISEILIDTQDVFGTRADLYAIKVDGRLLVDKGVWNNSQNWSDGFIPTSTTQAWPNPQTNAFDGNLTTFTYQNLSSLSWSNPLGSNVTSIGSGVRVYPRVSGGAGKTFTLNGGPTTSIAANGWTTINVGSETYFNSFTIGSGESYLAAIEVDGALLVDAGAQWNTSQVWTSMFGAGVTNGHNAFDGSTQTNAYATGSITWEPDTAFTNISSVRVYVELGNAAGSIQINNDANTANHIPVSALPNGDWFDLTDSINTNYSGTFSAVTAIRASGSFAYLRAIEVNGKILVDSGGGTYNTLFQTWDEYATFGLFVYDANQGKAIRTFELNKTYGLQDALTAANIFRLTAQPRYKVISYIENNGEYTPLEDVSEQLIAANATIDSLQYELDATQAELATASESIATGLTARTAIETDVAAILTRLSGIEADEIVDDATDTTLLTAFAALVARVEALENA